MWNYNAIDTIVGGRPGFGGDSRSFGASTFWTFGAWGICAWTLWAGSFWAGPVAALELGE